jgi:hypothetical protein
MDIKLTKIKSVKQKEKEDQIIQNADKCQEINSGIILRVGSRSVREDDFELSIKGREFISIEKINSVVEQSGFTSTHAFFTVGVLVESSRPKTSKNGK